MSWQLHAFFILIPVEELGGKCEFIMGLLGIIRALTGCYNLPDLICLAISEDYNDREIATKKLALKNSSDLQSAMFNVVDNVIRKTALRQSPQDQFSMNLFIAQACISLVKRFQESDILLKFSELSDIEYLAMTRTVAEKILYKYNV